VNVRHTNPPIELPDHAAAFLGQQDGGDALPTWLWWDGPRPMAKCLCGAAVMLWSSTVRQTLDGFPLQDFLAGRCPRCPRWWWAFACQFTSVPQQPPVQLAQAPPAAAVVPRGRKESMGL
jgi:hypothetical protein